jgi:hypothetical protein
MGCGEACAKVTGGRVGMFIPKLSRAFARTPSAAKESEEQPAE